MSTSVPRRPPAGSVHTEAPAIDVGYRGLKIPDGDSDETPASALRLVNDVEPPGIRHSLQHLVLVRDHVRRSTKQSGVPLKRACELAHRNAREQNVHRHEGHVAMPGVVARPTTIE